MNLPWEPRRTVDSKDRFSKRQALPPERAKQKD